MANLVTIKTGCGLESNKGLGSFQVSLRRGPEARFEVALQAQGGSAAVALDLPRDARKFSPDSRITSASSLLKARRILVPFDFSTASVRLLRWAISSAEETAAKVSVLHVVRPWVPLAGREEPGHFDVTQDRIDTARSLLRRLLDQICQSRDGVTFHVVVGHPVDEIVRFGRTLQAGLILMATHGQRGSKHPFLSATSERATRRATCPVLVVPESVLLRGEAEPGTLLTDFRRILVPSDLSADSATALRYAADLAQEHGAEVYVLNFSAPGLLRPVAGLEDGQDPKRLAYERLVQWINTRVDRTRNVIPLVCMGQPSAYLLLREAILLKADLLVFGPRGYSWSERLRLGSSTDAILRDAPCPVLSLRAEALHLGQ